MKKLTASEGMTLTNGEAFGKIVHLAQSDDGSGWYEITDAEAEILKRDSQEAEMTDYQEALAEMGVRFSDE